MLADWLGIGKQFADWVEQQSWHDYCYGCRGKKRLRLKTSHHHFLACTLDIDGQPKRPAMNLIKSLAPNTIPDRSASFGRLIPWSDGQAVVPKTYVEEFWIFA